MESLRNLWLAVMTILSALGIALLAAAIAAGTTERHFHFWTSSEMVVAYVCFVLAGYVLMAILYELPLPGAKRRACRLRRVMIQMKRGTELHDRCMNNDDGDELLDAYHDWFAEAQKVIAEVAPSFLVEFQQPPTSRPGYYVHLSSQASRVATTVERDADELRRVAEFLRR